MTVTLIRFRFHARVHGHVNRTSWQLLGSEQNPGSRPRGHRAGPTRVVPGWVDRWHNRRVSSELAVALGAFGGTARRLTDFLSS
jgi:hypothetical protein